MTVDADDDGDGWANCADNCQQDPGKSEPGVCGCGTPDTPEALADTDLDSTINCMDGCPLDALKTAPGDCGCGEVDIDGDGDGVASCGGLVDQCDSNPTKLLPGWCGCSIDDIDSDGDGYMDCVDECPSDPDKQEEGACGCGKSESSCGVRATALVVGHVADANVGSFVSIAGRKSLASAGGARDGFVALIEPSTGGVVAATTQGSAEDDMWLCVQSNEGHSSAQATLVVAGGTTGGSPAFLGLQSSATHSAVQRAVVAAYPSADAFVASVTPRWVHAWGHNVDAVTASTSAVAIQAASLTTPLIKVVVAGAFSGGALNIPLASGATAELRETDCSNGATFVAALDGSTGDALWAVPLGGIVHGPYSLALFAPTQRAVVVTTVPSGSCNVTAVGVSSGATVWSTRLTSFTCRGVAITGSGTVAVSGSVANSTALMGVPPLSVNGAPILYEHPPTLLLLSVSDGKFLGVQPLALPAGAVVADAIAVDDALGDSASVLLAGAVDNTTHGGHTSAFAQVTVGLTTDADLPQALYWQGGQGDEFVTATVALPGSLAVVGFVHSWTNNTARVGRKFVAARNGKSSAAVMFISEHGAAHFGEMVVGPNWGVHGDAAFTSVARASDHHVLVGGYYSDAALGSLQGLGLPSYEVSYPHTLEPLVVCVADSGVPLWVLTGDTLGATAGRDEVAAVGYDERTATGVVAVTSVDNSTAWWRDSTSPAAVGVTVFRGTAGDTAVSPRSFVTMTLSGTNVSIDATGASIARGGAKVVVAGTVTPVATIGGQPRMRVPVSTASVAEDAVTIAVDAAGGEQAWVAVFDVVFDASGVGTLTLDWVRTFAAVGTAHGLQLSPTVASLSQVALCMSGASSAWESDSVGGGVGGVLPSLSGTSQIATAIPSTPGVSLAHVVMLSLDEGTVQWVRSLGADGKNLACGSLAHEAGVLVATATVESEGARAVDVYAGTTKLTTVDLEGTNVEATMTTVFAEFSASDGNPALVHVLGAVPLSPAAAAPMQLHRNAVPAVSVAAGRAYVACSAAAGMWVTASSQSTAGPTRVVGPAASPLVGSIGSWDMSAVVVPLASVLRGRHAAAPLPRSGSVVSTSSAPDGTPGEGRVVSVSFGATRILAVGSFKGALEIGNGLGTVSALGSVRDENHGTDAFGVMLDIRSPALAPVRFFTATVNSPPTMTEAFTASTASPNGHVHYVVGVADLGDTNRPVVSVNGRGVYLTAQGDDDGFVVALRDDDASPVWIAAPGHVRSADELLAVAASAHTVAVGGYFTSSAPDWGGSVFGGHVGTRQVAAVYVLDTNGGAIWGKGFATDEDGGQAVARSVAIHVNTFGVDEGIVVGGTFTGGSLTAGSYTLAPAASVGVTGFVLYLSIGNGNVVWASRIASGHSAASASVLTSAVWEISASTASVAVAGDFTFPQAYDMYVDNGDQDTVGGNAVFGTGIQQGFVALLDVTTGRQTSVVVPRCRAACSAVSVASVHGAATAVFTSDAAMTFGGVAVGDASTNSYAAVVEIGGYGGTVVQAVQPVGDGSTGVVHALGIAANNVSVAVVGWRNGVVTLPGAESVTAMDHETPTSSADMPFVVVLESMPPPSPLPIVRSRLVSPVAVGSSGLSVHPLDATVPELVHVGLGTSVAVTSISVLNASVATPAGATVYSNANLVASTPLGSVLVATDRVTGTTLWTQSLSDATGDVAIADATATPDGSMVCVVGTVPNAKSTTAWPTTWGHIGNSDATSDGGNGDVFVACVGSEYDSDGGVDANPVWTTVVTATTEHEAATAVSVSATVVYVAHIEGGQGNPLRVLDGGLTSQVQQEYYGRVCKVQSVPLVGGGGTSPTALQTLYFGTVSNSYDACRITSMAASADGTRLCIVGGARAQYSFHLGGSVYISESYPFAFAACYEVREGVQTPAIRWASVGTTVSSSRLPFPAPTGVMMHHATGAVIVTGRHSDLEGIMWGEARAVGATTAAETGVEGALEATTAYVASFRFDMGNDSGQGVKVDAQWVAQFAATSSHGIRSVTRAALDNQGACVVAMCVTSAVRLSPYRPLATLHTPTGLMPASYALIVRIAVGANGGSGGGRVLGYEAFADTRPRPPAAAQVAALSLASATTPEQARSPAADIVLVGVARGRLGSSTHYSNAMDAALTTPTGEGAFAVFHAALGSSAATGSLAPFTDASTVDDIAPPVSPGDEDGRYVVQFEVLRTGGDGAITSGEWKTGPGSGSGVEFLVTPGSISAQQSTADEWLLVEGTVTHASTTSLGEATLGSTGGQRFADLKALSFRTAGAVDTGTSFKVRRVRLVPRTSDCVPCGRVPVREFASLLPRVVPGNSLHMESACVLTPVDGSGTLLPAPLDASTLVDPTCNCLRGAEVVWQQQGGPPVISVRITTPSGDAGAFTSRIYADNSSLPSGWIAYTAFIDVESHVRTWDVDWQAVTHVQFVLESCLGVSASVAVRDVVLRRRCPHSSAVLHPKSTVLNTEVPVSRGNLGMTRGSTYRVIAYETNMWGQDSSPTCSPTFVSDDTPPDTSGGTCINVAGDRTGPDTSATAVSFTKHSNLQLTWAGAFSEPDSAPDNLLLYRVDQVAVGHVGGPLLHQLESEEKLLPTVSTGEFVSTGVLELEDGVEYFPALGVCNVRPAHAVFALPVLTRMCCVSCVNVTAARKALQHHRSRWHCV